MIEVFCNCEVSKDTPQHGKLARGFQHGVSAELRFGSYGFIIFFLFCQGFST